jgi:hypothetical protein
VAWNYRRSYWGTDRQQKLPSGEQYADLLRCDISLRILCSYHRFTSPLRLGISQITWHASQLLHTNLLRLWGRCNTYHFQSAPSLNPHMYVQPQQAPQLAIRSENPRTSLITVYVHVHTEQAARTNRTE